MNLRTHAINNFKRNEREVSDMIATTVFTASRFIPIIVKAARIGIHLIPVIAVAEPYVTESIRKKRDGKSSHNGAGKFAHKA